jgi:hypothetical protein
VREVREVSEGACDMSTETRTRTCLGKLILETAMGTEKQRVFSCVEGEHVWLRVGETPDSRESVCIGCGKREQA